MSSSWWKRNRYFKMPQATFKRIHSVSLFFNLFIEDMCQFTCFFVHILFVHILFVFVAHPFLVAAFFLYTPRNIPLCMLAYTKKKNRFSLCLFSQSFCFRSCCQLKVLNNSIDVIHVFRNWQPNSQAYRYQRLKMRKCKTVFMVYSFC